MSTTINQYGQPIGPALPGWKPPLHPPRETMAGRYCVLQPLDADRHAASLFATIQHEPDDRNWTYLFYGPFATYEAYRDWMIAECLGKDPLFFAIVDRRDQKPIGVASYLRITPSSGFMEVGHLNYSSRLQRSPIATEAMYLMMKKAFELGYRRYEWKCDSLNAPSRSAAERLGFSFEGIFRQATVYKGRSRDSAWFSIIDSEWPELEKVFLKWLDPSNFDANGKQLSRLSDLTRPLLKQRDGSRI